MQPENMATRRQQGHDQGSFKYMLPHKSPSTSQILTLITGVPITGTLLLLSGLSLAGSLIGLAVTIPLFILFSPILVPAAFIIGMAVLGFIASGAFGITALSSLRWMANHIRRMRGVVPEMLQATKRREQDTTGLLAQKGREAGQAMQSKA